MQRHSPEAIVVLSFDTASAVSRRGQARSIALICIRSNQGITDASPRSCRYDRLETGDQMNIVDMAHASGFAVILDGRIGREEYQSVCGSVSALQRFAEAVRQDAASQRESAPLKSPPADLSGRLRRSSIGGTRKSGGRAAFARRASHNARRMQS